MVKRIVQIGMVGASLVLIVLGVQNLFAGSRITCLEVFSDCVEGGCATNDDWKTAPVCFIWCKPPDVNSYTECYSKPI